MRRFLALILVIIFVPLGVLLIWTTSLNRYIEQPDRIVGIMHQNDLFAVATNTVLDEQLTQLAQGQFAESGVSLDSLRDTVKKTFSPLWIETEVNQLLLTFSHWFASNDQELHLNLDLTSLKQEGFHNLQLAIDDATRSLPQCEEADLRMVEANTQILCRPPNMSLGTFRSMLNKQAESMKGTLDEQIPNQIDIVDALRQQNPQAIETLATIRSTYHTVQQAMQWTLWSLFVLLAGIGLLVWKPLYSVLRWLGTSVLLAGVFAGGIAIALMMVVPEFMGTLRDAMLTGGMPETELNGIFPSVSGSILALVRDICLPIAILSGALVAGAIVLYISASIVKAKGR